MGEVEQIHIILFSSGILETSSLNWPNKLNTHFSTPFSTIWTRVQISHESQVKEREGAGERDRASISTRVKVKTSAQVLFKECERVAKLLPH